jgi:hypothetical protein
MPAEKTQSRNQPATINIEYFAILRKWEDLLRGSIDYLVLFARGNSCTYITIDAAFSFGSPPWLETRFEALRKRLQTSRELP